MRKWLFAPMIGLLLLNGCGGVGQQSEDLTAELRSLYRDMAGCTMEATVSSAQDGRFWEAVLHCEDVPGGETTVEVLKPEEIAGITAILRDDDWSLAYDGTVLNAGRRSSISPAECLPRLVSAVRDGWLVEENTEEWEETPCLRLMLDQTGEEEQKIVSTVWLKQSDGTLLRGEIAVDGEIILTAEFTSFAFYDTIPDQSGEEVPSSAPHGN